MLFSLRRELPAFQRSSGHLIVCFPWIQRLADGGFKILQGRMSSGGESRAKPWGDDRDLLQSSLGIVEHRSDIQATGRLVERPESLGTVGIQLEELLQKMLGNLRGA